MDYDKFLSEVSANRYNNPIRHLVKLLDSASPEMIPLSAGFPNPELFPISRATFETRDGDSIVLDGPKMIRALQYSGSPGFPDLIEWLKKLQVSFRLNFIFLLLLVFYYIWLNKCFDDVR
jgi:kynurenine/2-aminoadipate aminotransferase